MTLFHGLFPLPWWGLLLAALALTHVTIAAVTIYLHRHQAHRALSLHPLPAHFFRFWLWLTTGMITREWAAVHRKHHARVDTVEDPHSPQVHGIGKVLTRGLWLYRSACRNRADIERYGHGAPDDWLERRLYTPHKGKGVLLMLVLDLLLFGLPGLAVWGTQMIWIPLFAAGVVNGAGHYWGYRNFDSEDASTNIFPLGILIGGEELHNNHHTFGTSARLSYRWFEVDIGWLYIRLMAFARLATVHRVAPRPRCGPVAAPLDAERLQAIIANRYALTARFARDLAVVCHDELARVQAALPGCPAPASLRRWLDREAARLQPAERAELDRLLAASPMLASVYAMRQELGRLWQRSSRSRDELLRDLHDWCARAEASGIAALERFAFDLRRLAPAA